MGSIEQIARAERFLAERGIRYATPAVLGKTEGDKIEIIFAVAEIYDPTVAVVDPPDIRVWVDLSDDQVELIEQM